MALTRPKLGQINTNVTVLTDAITVLSAGANQANVDVGFLINRAHGLVPNAAFYYSETLDTFVTAFTNNTGGTDSNILVTNYADFTAGNVYTTGLYWTGNGLPINFATGGSGSGNITVRSLFSGNLQPNVTVANITAIEFDEESGFDIQNRGSGNVLVAMNSTFKYWEVTGSEQLVAVGLDHITINSGNNIVITSNANATPYKSITFSVNSNPVFNNVSAAGYFWANGTPFVSSNYGNTDVSAYLDSYFIYANANAASQTTAFTTLDANVGSYQLWANTSITNLQSNAAFQANLIDVLTGNAASQGSLLDVLVANAVEQSANLTSLLSNAAAQEASLTSLVNNAASQSGAIDSINANVGSYQLYANANAATQATAINTIDANLGAYQVWANATFSVSSYGDSNVASYLSSYYTYANANAATQTTEIVDLRANIEAANAAIITANTGMKSYVDDQIVSAGGYGNTQVAAYLPTYSGNLNPGNITASGTIVGGGVRNTSGSTPPANPTVGDTWYDTDNDTLLRYINDGDSNQWVDLSGIIVGETPVAFGNAEVAAYLTTYTGNISAGNIISGNIVPSANVTYDLGSATNRWRDLYMSGNTIYLGSSVFTQSNGSVVIIPPPTTEFPNPTGMVISPYGTISTVTTSNGNVTGSVTTSNISSFSNITVTNQATIGNVVSDSYTYSNGSAIIPQGLASTSTPSFAGLTVNGNVLVTGRLTVDQIEAVSAVQISVQDPLLYLTANVLYPWTYDTGIYSQAIGGPANVYAHHGMVRSYSNGQWGFFSNVQSEPSLTINWSDTGIVWDKVKAGELVLANSTASTSTTTGALQVAGGIGVQGNAVVNAIYTDNYRFANGTVFSSSTYGNTEVGAYLPTHSANVAASNVVVTGNVIQNGWKTYATASKLTIYYNSSPLFTIYTNGNIVAAGDVQAYGSP